MSIITLALLILLSAATRSQPRFQATKSQARLIFSAAILSAAILNVGVYRHLFSPTPPLLWHYQITD